MKFRQLEYLVSVADAQSFAKAASLLNVSQPTLSQQVRALEQQMGLSLLERSGSGVWPTPAGREVVERARLILRDMRELGHVARRAGSRVSGIIRLGTTPTLGPYLLSPAIVQLHKTLPNLRIHVREGIPAHRATELAEGQIDLYLGPLPIADSMFIIEPLFRERLYLVAAKDHPLAGRPLVTREQLVDLPVLSIDHRHHYHRQVSDIADRFGLRLVPDYEGTSLDSVHQMAASGLACAILPALYIGSEVGGLSGLSIVNVEGWNAYRAIALAWRRSSTLAAEFQVIGAGIAQAAKAMMIGELPITGNPG